MRSLTVALACCLLHVMKGQVVLTPIDNFEFVRWGTSLHETRGPGWRGAVLEEARDSRTGAPIRGRGGFIFRREERAFGIPMRGLYRFNLADSLLVQITLLFYAFNPVPAAARNSVGAVWARLARRYGAAVEGPGPHGAIVRRWSFADTRVVAVRLDEPWLLLSLTLTPRSTGARDPTAATLP